MDANQKAQCTRAECRTVPFWADDELRDAVVHGPEDSVSLVCHCQNGTNPEREANADLIAEAFTVLHETGLSPRELADKAKALSDALRLVADRADAPLYGRDPHDVLGDCSRIAQTALHA